MVFTKTQTKQNKTQTKQNTNKTKQKTNKKVFDKASPCPRINIGPSCFQVCRQQMQMSQERT